MILTGEIKKDRGHYAALLEQLGVYAQGRTRAAARSALAATILEHAAEYGPLDGWKVAVTDDGEATLYVASTDPRRMIALLLRRQREIHDLSLADVTRAMGAKSRNGWAQYEQARSEPSIGKLQEMLAAVAPALTIAIVPRTARVIPRWDEEADDDAELDRLLADPSPANIDALRVRRAARRRVKAAG